MIIAHNGTCTNFCNVRTDVRIAKETGYDGIELIGSKLYRLLEQGFSIEDFYEYLDGFPVIALGFVPDIERNAPEARQALLEETEEMCRLAQKLNCPLVQILTGPIGPGVGEGVPDSYTKIMDIPWPQLRKITAGNLSAISAIGKKYKVSFYLEALSWAPISTLGQMCELIETAECDNIGVVIDFWHCFTSGATPEDVAGLDKRIIKGVHVCDSVAGDGSGHVDRDIWTGAGIIPQKQWVDAVRSTGYDGWMSCELFSAKHWELNPWQTAGLLRQQLEYLLT